jgi:hypothetical protein
VLVTVDGWDGEATGELVLERRIARPDTSSTAAPLASATTTAATTTTTNPT